jgi:hypothetical protein
MNNVDVSKTRLYYSGGRVSQFSDASLAYAIYLSAPKCTRIAFRSAGDTRPVYAWDYVDKI